MYHCVQLSYGTHGTVVVTFLQHGTVLITFPPSLQTIIIAQTLPTGREWECNYKSRLQG